MATTISVVAQKGGVSKTTTTANLAITFGNLGKRVLLIDLDYQANLSTSFGVRASPTTPNVRDWLIGEGTFEQTVVKTVDENVDLIPAHKKIVNLVYDFMSEPARQYHRLVDPLEAVRDAYDLVLIDTGAKLDAVVMNALVASDFFLVPTLPKLWSVQGVTEVLATADAVTRFAPQLRPLGILMTQYDKRRRIDRDAVQYCEQNYGDLLFKTRIKVSQKFEDALAAQQHATDYWRPIAMTFQELALEMLARTSSTTTQNAA